MKILDFIIIVILFFWLKGIKKKSNGCYLRSKPKTPKPNIKPMPQKVR